MANNKLYLLCHYVGVCDVDVWSVGVCNVDVWSVGVCNVDVCVVGVCVVGVCVVGVCAAILFAIRLIFSAFPR